MSMSVVEAADPVVPAPATQRLRIDIASGDQLGVRGLVPARQVGAGDAADADDGDLERGHALYLRRRP
jgi:hypothetical protein